MIKALGAFTRIAADVLVKVSAVGLVAMTAIVGFLGGMCSTPVLPGQSKRH